jgi:hypothetical protein
MSQKVAFLMLPPVHVREDELTRRGSRRVSGETELVKVVAGDLAATPAPHDESSTNEQANIVHHE